MDRRDVALAFWDQRILYLLRTWERNGKIERAALTPP
jgi:hypothetical protein